MEDERRWGGAVRLRVRAARATLSAKRPIGRCSIEPRTTTTSDSRINPGSWTWRRVVMLLAHMVLYVLLAERVRAVLLMLRTSGDMEAHAQIAAICIRENLWPANPAMYLLVAWFGRWGAPPGPLSYWHGMEHLSYVLINLLVAAVLGKVLLTRHIVFAEGQADRAGTRMGRLAQAGRSAGATLAAVALLAAFALPVPPDHYYLGQFPPSVWHNSTTIALAPLAVLLFYCSYRFLLTGGYLPALATAGLCLANLAVKPSFVLPFVIVFPAFALLQFREENRRALFLAAGIWLLCVGALAWQTYYTYFDARLLLQFYRERYQLENIPRERIEISWLTVWQMYSANLVRSLLYSIAFPLAYAVLFPVRAWRDKLLLYAAGLFAAALLLTCMLTETGYRRPHANFFWQTILANYVLFTATVVSLLRPDSRGAGGAAAPPAAAGRWWQGRTWLLARRTVVWAVFGAHVWAGVTYLQRVLATGLYQ
jgi:hypothetical protein